MTSEASKTSKLADAFAFAEQSHRGQLRKGGRVGYISHPMAVSALVQEAGGSEDQACGALLHDVIEDCGVTAKELADRFGVWVSRIVAECTDVTSPAGQPKAPWIDRKVGFLERIPALTDQALLVCVADKVHNAESTLQDLEIEGDSVWGRFNGRPEQVIWYYQSLAERFSERDERSDGALTALIRRLSDTAEALKALYLSRQPVLVREWDLFEQEEGDEGEPLILAGFTEAEVAKAFARAYVRYQRAWSSISEGEVRELDESEEEELTRVTVDHQDRTLYRTDRDPGASALPDEADLEIVRYHVSYSDWRDIREVLRTRGQAGG